LAQIPLEGISKAHPSARRNLRRNETPRSQRHAAKLLGWWADRDSNSTLSELGRYRTSACCRLLHKITFARLHLLDIPKQNVATQRAAWIDAAKGIGIVAVLIGHVCAPAGLLAKAIFSFHMPLFFLISGYLFNLERNASNFRGMAWRKFRHLIVPYFYSWLAVVAAWLLFVCPRPFVDTPATAIARVSLLSLAGYLYGIGQTNVFAPLSSITPVGPVWFLPTLFCAEIVFLFFLLATRKVNFVARAVGALALALTGRLIGEYVFLPWGADIGFVSIIFLFAGYELKARDYVERADLLHLAICAAIWFLCLCTSNLSMNNRAYTDFPIALAGGIAGSILILSISKAAAKYAPALAFIGQRSLVILIAHPILLDYLPAGSPLRYHWSVETAYLLGASLAASAAIDAILRRCFAVARSVKNKLLAQASSDAIVTDTTQ
jgi:acyltransferase